MSLLPRRRNAVHGSGFRGQRRTSYDPRWRTRASVDHTLADTRRKIVEEKEEEQHGLTPMQVEAFREVFNLFDINGGGTIDADELDSALRTVDIQLEQNEIRDVLQVLDEDGNGEIDFDEFLTLMTSTEKFLENLRGAGTKQDGKENVLFSALAKFMRKSALSSLSEIERYYNNKVRKSPHVVGHYAAGARLIGLTEKQMAKHLATLNSVTDGENNDSPYAQPLCMFHSNIPSKILGKRRGNGKIRLKIIVNKNTKDIATEANTQDGVEDTSSSIDLPNNGATSKKQSVSLSTTDIPIHKPKVNHPQSALLRVRPMSVPLPAVSVKGIQRKNPSMLTIEDLPLIRKKVQLANENYHKKQDAVREDSAQLCSFSDLSAIPSRTLQQQFKLILEAYSFRPRNVPPYLYQQLKF